MDIKNNPASFAASDWMNALLQEYEDEGKMEARWPTLLIQSTGRKLIWNLCTILKVNSKGVPGSACRLLERYLSRHIRTYLQQTRDTDEWERYKDTLASRFNLMMVSCIQLAAKMSDLLAPLTASSLTSALMKEGIVYSKAEIIDMEFHVYSTLDFRIPLWTTLEMSEFLATQVGLGDKAVLEAIGLVVNLTEYHRDQLELHMRCWSSSCNTPSSSSSASIGAGSSTNKVTVANLHVCAGVVVAAARYLRSPHGDATDRLAALVRSTADYIKAITDNIFKHIIPERIIILKFNMVAKAYRIRIQPSCSQEY